MSRAKRLVREQARAATLARDHNTCRACGKKPGDLTSWDEAITLDMLDAHHITPREQMPGGGYVLGNLITVCPDCHMKAEDFLNVHTPRGEIDESYAPSRLYALIGTTYQRALMEAENT